MLKTQKKIENCDGSKEFLNNHGGLSNEIADV